MPLRAPRRPEQPTTCRVRFSLAQQPVCVSYETKAATYSQTARVVTTPYASRAKTANMNTTQSPGPSTTVSARAARRVIVATVTSRQWSRNTWKNADGRGCDDCGKAQLAADRLRSRHVPGQPLQNQCKLCADCPPNRCARAATSRAPASAARQDGTIKDNYFTCVTCQCTRGDHTTCEPCSPGYFRSTLRVTVALHVAAELPTRSQVRLPTCNGYVHRNAATPLYRTRTQMARTAHHTPRALLTNTSASAHTRLTASAVSSRCAPDKGTWPRQGTGSKSAPRTNGARRISTAPSAGTKSAVYPPTCRLTRAASTFPPPRRSRRLPRLRQPLQCTEQYVTNRYCSDLETCDYYVQETYGGTQYESAADASRRSSRRHKSCLQLYHALHPGHREVAEPTRTSDRKCGQCPPGTHKAAWPGTASVSAALLAPAKSSFTTDRSAMRAAPAAGTTRAASSSTACDYTCALAASSRGTAATLASLTNMTGPSAVARTRATASAARRDGTSRHTARRSAPSAPRVSSRSTTVQRIAVTATALVAPQPAARRAMASAQRQQSQRTRAAATTACMISRDTTTWASRATTVRTTRFSNSRISLVRRAAGTAT